jgi:hypothetical protein
MKLTSRQTELKTAEKVELGQVKVSDFTIYVIGPLSSTFTCASTGALEGACTPREDLSPFVDSLLLSLLAICPANATKIFRESQLLILFSGPWIDP